MELYRLIVQEIDIIGDIELSEDILLIDDLGFDSLQLINLIVGIEDAFQIKFADADMLFDRFNRIGDLYSLIEELIMQDNGEGTDEKERK